MGIELVKTAQSSEHGKVSIVVETHENGTISQYTIREDGTSYGQDIDQDGFQISDIYDLTPEESAQIVRKLINN